MGIVVAHYSPLVDKQMLDFVKEFGLVLFVFTLACNLAPASSPLSDPKDGDGICWQPRWW
jgi:hypothetical protein